MHIYYICDRILGTSSGQAKEGLAQGHFFLRGRGVEKSTTQALGAAASVPGRGKKRGMCAERAARQCPCAPLGPRPPVTRGRATRAPPHPRYPRGQHRRGCFARGRSIALPVCSGNAHTHTHTHHPSQRHHNLNPSPTRRELQVTDHVGLTPGRAGAPAPLPPPARVLQARAPGSAKPPAEGSRVGGEREKRN